ncbi:MAG: MBL fold metallo-hydrolase, partial [Actinomycetia bacterium]|nr:MBL fold metallo-hydrolase [Actinomycetes bacterium]
MQIKLSFLGAARNVTGSRFLVEVDGLRVLVDCGFFQERQFMDRNWHPFPVPPESIHAVLLTHAHLDHCGLLPKLVRDGFRGKVYATAATAEIARIIMLDSAHIQQEDAKYKRKRHKRQRRKSSRPVVPLYSTSDAMKCSSFFSPVDYDTPVNIDDRMQVVFHDAGHVFGSSTITLRVRQDGTERTILFSGDVGRRNMPILEDPTIVDHADYVLVESTYGDREHESVEDVNDALAEVINSAVKAGGNIVVPSFALERSQD